MREIKFRGKSDKYGWVYGNLSYREEDGNSAVFIEDQGYCGDLTPPLELEFEKGPGYWKNKYLRLKEKMQNLIDEKEDDQD